MVAMAVAPPISENIRCTMSIWSIYPIAVFFQLSFNSIFGADVSGVLWHWQRMAGAIMNGEFVRRRMKELGLRQKDLAASMNLPQSAISNIIKGKRRIKYEEAQILYYLLDEDQSKAKDVPVILLSDADRWQDARQITRLMAHYTNSNLSDAGFIIQMDAGDQGMLPGLLHIVVEPAKYSLYSNGVYLVEVGNSFRFYRYNEGPSRLHPMPPFQEEKTLEVGQAEFRVIGEVQAVMKRPDTLPQYGADEEPDISFDK